MGGEPNAFLGAYVVDQRAQDDDARAVADIVRVHREEEHRAFLIGDVELVLVDLKDLAGRAVAASQVRIYLRNLMQLPRYQGITQPANCIE